MHWPKAVARISLALIAALPLAAAQFSGASALEYARKVTAFGVRPSGSPALQKLRAYIESQARAHGWQVSEDTFTADTPDGPVTMKNIIARLPGDGKRAIVFTGHYDTKKLAGFVGANDGGSSAAFLLEMARVLPGETRLHDVYLVWFDGEEAVRQWTDTDSLYGSRHLAAKWTADGTLGRVRALINVDMIGDKDLEIVEETASDADLRALVWRTAESLGYGKYFGSGGGEIEDDHIPFLKAGIAALDLIDFDYGPGNSYWHTPADTMDKLGAHSFEVVGNVLMAVWRRLDQ